MSKPSSFKSKKNYEELILELATSPDKLKKIKIKLEANRHYSIQKNSQTI